MARVRDGASVVVWLCLVLEKLGFKIWACRDSMATDPE